MEKEKKVEILGKIKKLMALGMKHEDTPEGQSALLKAKKLMAQYDVRFIDVEEDGSVLDENIDKMDIPWHKGRNDFESHLAGHIARTFDCEYLISNKRTKWKSHVIVGTKSDMEIASWLFKFTRLQCYRLAEQQSYSGKELRTYFYGLYFTLQSRITDTFGKVESEKHSESECTALIVVKTDAVERKLKEFYPKIKTGRKSRPLSGSMDAFHNGNADAEKVSLNKAINN
jgi:hypothetical protein